MDRLAQLAQHLAAAPGGGEPRLPTANPPAQLAGLASGTGGQTHDQQHARPRIAVLVSFWGATSSHADWIATKLIDGYWWDGAYTPSQVDVVSIYMHQHDTSLLGQKIAEAKGILSHCRLSIIICMITAIVIFC